MEFGLLDGEKLGEHNGGGFVETQDAYRIMPYTSAGRKGTTHRRSLFESQAESFIISNICDAVVQYDLYVHNRLEYIIFLMVLAKFVKICQMNM